MVVHQPLRHVIVDGSNIATEGRDIPSLAQLDEAVQAFIREYEPEIVTVVVDATFPNRIAHTERKDFEEALAAGEVITPPAGAIGRGDAFVLQIADRSGATVLSNDSFQEFHGTYDWLFDPGRLIGGKPVAHVGWVFMARTPVRGPASRRSVSAAKRVQAAARAAEAAPAAGEAAPEAEAAPRRARPAKAATAVRAAPREEPGEERREPAAAGAPGAVEPEEAAVEPSPPAPAYNDALPFIDFVGEHPLGSEVDAVVEHFGSHGAYLRVGDVRAYAPLKNLGAPAPRSAKEVLRIGESRRFVVAAIDPPRRGVDLALPKVPAATRARQAAARQVRAVTAPGTGSPAARKSPAKRAAAKTSPARQGATGKPKAGEPAGGKPRAATARQGATGKPKADKAAGGKPRAARARQGATGKPKAGEAAGGKPRADTGRQGATGKPKAGEAAGGKPRADRATSGTSTTRKAKATEAKATKATKKASR